jgi:hypothetical protein
VINNNYTNGELHSPALRFRSSHFSSFYHVFFIMIGSIEFQDLSLGSTSQALLKGSTHAYLFHRGFQLIYTQLASAR